MRSRTVPFLLAVLLASASMACGDGATGAPADGTARILLGTPDTLDPAVAGDAGSAAVIGQLFETLTTFDADLRLRPALAASWDVEDGGRRIVFRLRPDQAFSDGSPLRASDVVRSWLRVIAPQHPSPLSSLAMDIDGAAAYLRGEIGADLVGLRADDASGTVTVELTRPAAEFVSVVASPTFSVVPPQVDGPGEGLSPGDGFVASGGYRLADETATTLELVANERYWAGMPAIVTISVLTDTGGRSGVQVFEAGEVDYAGISASDAGWIAYDATLGPQLREVPALSVAYYGFDTTRPPFDDPAVRRAFAMAVDWRRIAELDVDDPDDVATSMVPPGIPGRSDEDVLPPHDPAAARAALAEAGYPGGAGFPVVTLMTGGYGFDAAVAQELERELEIDVEREVMTDGYFGRLDRDPPHIWALTWIADYPGRNDFLGVLLGTGSSSNVGGWSSPAFDAAIAEAGAALDPADAAAAYDRAEAIVRDEAPVVPVAYSGGWALARDGLLGAGENGLGLLRFAGLSWATTP